MAMVRSLFNRYPGRTPPFLPERVDAYPDDTLPQLEDDQLAGEIPGEPMPPPRPPMQARMQPPVDAPPPPEIPPPPAGLNTPPPPVDMSVDPRFAGDDPDVSRLNRLTAQRESMKPPERPKPNKWQMLGAAALGGLGGYYNAANPRARPIDTSETTDAIMKGPKYVGQMQDYERKRADIDDQLKSTDSGIRARVSAETLGATKDNRAVLARQAGENAEDRRKKDKEGTEDRRSKMLNDMVNRGERRVPIDVPTPQGWEDIGHDPLFEMGPDGKPSHKVIRDPHFGQVQVSQPQADASGGMLVPGQWVAAPKDPLGTVLGNATKPDKEAKNLNPEDILLHPNDFTPEQVKSAEKLMAQRHQPQQPITILTPEALDQSARRYLKSGELPPLGMGDKSTRQNIINRAAELDHDSDIAGSKAEYQAGKSALTSIERQYGVTRTAEKTADKTLSIVEDVSNKVDRTGSPLVNRYLLYLKGQVAGDTETQKLDNAIETASSEYARVIAGGTGNQQLTDAAQAKGKRMLQAAMGKGTMKAVMNQMRQEMAAKNSAYSEVLKDLRSGDVAGEKQVGGGSPKVGDTKKFPNGNTGVWDGHGWVAK